MPTPEVKSYLDRQGAKYVVIAYEHAYDAQHVAAGAHVSGKQLAKTVVLDVDDQLVMAVLQADTRVDCDRLRAAMGAGRVKLATEHDFKERFGDCEVGAMPPLGPLYDIDIYVDEALSLEETIVFRAGRHGELIRMSYSDFAKVAAPKVMDLAYRR